MKRFLRFTLPFLAFNFLFVMLVAGPLAAQVDRGGIVGTISDPSGARVPGAEVLVTNLSTNETVKLTTDASGNYAANLLRIGTYSVAVSKEGFDKIVKPSVDVGVNQVVRLDLGLRVGKASQTVEVTGAPPLLQTETSSLGTIETERRISELPLNGRDFIALAYLGPGANGGMTGSNAQGGVFENERANEALSVNGLRVTNNNYLLNGIDNNEFGLGGVIALPPPDAIQEFRTEENSMSAEFGRGGAAVNVVVKSGTNQIHGGAYEFIRNSSLDACNYFLTGCPSATSPKPPFKRNQFGAFFGAPIKKNKTFIFGDYQGTRIRQGITYVNTVPTAAERAGDFRDRLTGTAFSPCPTAGGPSFDTGTIFDPYSTHDFACPDGTVVSLRNPIMSNGQFNVLPPGAINKVGSNIANFYPLPNLPGLVNNYVLTPNMLNNQDQFDIRLDHSFRQADQIFASYSFGDVRADHPGPLGQLGGGDCCFSNTKTRAQHWGLGWTHTVSTTLLNDAHGGYMRYAVNALPLNFGSNVSSQVLSIPNANRPTDPNSSGLVNVDVAGFQSFGDSEFTPEVAIENIFQLADTVTWVHGRHSTKFGIDFRRQQRNFYQVTAPRGLFVFGGGYTADLSTSNGGSGLADTLLGVPSYSEQDALQGLYPTRYWDLAEFIQDDFRIRPNFTLNIGLRYEVTSPANGRVGNFDLARAIVINSYGPNPVPHGGVKFDKNDWAPRIGIAWSPTHNTVVHSAFGVFYSAEGNIFDDLGENPPLLAFSAQNFNIGGLPSASQLASVGFPSVLPFEDPLHPSGLVKTTGSTRWIPRILEWNLTVQHQFGENWVAQMGYVGTKANRLWNHESSDLNQPYLPLDSNFSDPTGNMGRPYFSVLPNLNTILPLDYAQFHSFYNAFQASLNRHFANGFNLLASYTFAHNLGNADGNVGSFVQNAHAVNQDYGPVQPDLRHRFVVSYLYDLPVGRGRHYLSGMGGIGEAVLGGWEIGGIISAQTGEAVTGAMSSDLSNTGSFNYRPNQVGNPYDFSFGQDVQAAMGCNPGHQDLTCWFNPAAFVTPPLAPGQQSAHMFGDSRIGNLRGPNLFNMDFVLQKNFKIRERQQLEFRSEFFNLLNHPNFGLPGGGFPAVDVPGGGSITSTATDNRQIEFALKYTF